MPIPDRETPDVTKFCDELRFNRFHALLILLGMLTLIFDGYYSQIISYLFALCVLCASAVCFQTDLGSRIYLFSILRYRVRRSMPRISAARDTFP